MSHKTVIRLMIGLAFCWWLVDLGTYLVDYVWPWHYVAGWTPGSSPVTVVLGVNY